MEDLIKKVEAAWNKMLETKNTQLMGLCVKTFDKHEKVIQVPYLIMLDNNTDPCIRIIDRDTPYTMTGWYTLNQFKKLAKAYNFKEMEATDEI